MADDFYSTYLPHAQEASQRTGIDPRLILAQAALESGWGQHAPGNNMFGIKSHGQAGGNTLATTEYGPNGAYPTADSFRAYDNPGASFGGYADFMLANPRYKGMMGAQGLEAQAAALGKSGYATDPNYGANVLKIAQGFPGGDGVSAINNAAGVKPQQPTGALGFSGDAASGPTGAPASGTLKFNDDGGSGKQDNRFGLGDLFGASDETKAKMHGIGARLVRAAAALSAGVNPGQAAQFNALGKSLEEQNKTDYQYTMGPNGQLVKINKDTGEVSFATLPGGGKGSFGIVMGKDANGAPTPIGKINHSTGEFTRYGGDAPAQTGPQPGGDPNLSGQERFDSMAPDDQREVTAMLEGRGQPITSLSLRNPVLRARYEAARAVDPSFDTAKYAARQKMVGGLAQSTPGSAGGQLDSSGAMISHVTDLADDYIKLHNSGGYGATLLNAGKNLTSAAGSERDQLLKSIATHSMNFSGEVTKQLSGAPGGQEERQRRVGLINQPNAAPSTQAAALEAELMDAINKRQATLDRVKDTMGEAFVAQNPRFKKQEEALALAKSKLETLRNGPAIKDAPKQAPTIPSSWEDAQKAGWK